MAHKYTLTVNGFDLTDMVERDSYSTSLFPVTTPIITTMDGIDHTRLIRHKARVQVSLNPQTAEQTALLTAALMTSPMTVQFHCLQRNMDVTATMIIDEISADYLSRCLALGQKWMELDDLTFTEL